MEPPAGPGYLETLGVGQGLREELALGTRTPRFRTAAIRQATMLAGVFALGWPAHEVAVFLLLEAFLFLSFRAAAEISLDPRYGATARGPWATGVQIALHFLVAAPLVGCIVGFFGGFAFIPFPDVPWREFVHESIRSPSFLGAFALLAGSIVYDTALFARRVAAGRGEEERAADDQMKWVAMARPLILVATSFTLGIAASLGLGVRALALAVAAALLFVEAVPHRVARIFDEKAG